jgi:hypothetical protein
MTRLFMSRYKNTQSQCCILVICHEFLQPWLPLCKFEGVQGYEPKTFSTHMLCDDRVPECKLLWCLFGSLQRLPWCILPTLTGISRSTMELVSGSRRLSSVDVSMCINAPQCVHTHVDFARHQPRRFCTGIYRESGDVFSMWTILSVSTTLFGGESVPSLYPRCDELIHDKICGENAL